jgi:hypothetical protein
MLKLIERYRRARKTELSAAEPDETAGKEIVRREDGIGSFRNASWFVMAEITIDQIDAPDFLIPEGQEVAVVYDYYDGPPPERLDWTTGVVTFRQKYIEEAGRTFARLNGAKDYRHLRLLLVKPRQTNR